jgi:hypothetical protein
VCDRLDCCIGLSVGWTLCWTLSQPPLSTLVNRAVRNIFRHIQTTTHVKSTSSSSSSPPPRPRYCWTTSDSSSLSFYTLLAELIIRRKLWSRNAG